MENNQEYRMFEDYPDVLSVGQLQSALGIGKNTAYQLIHNQQIGHIRIGKKIRIPKRYLIDYIYERCDNRDGNSGQICADAVNLRR